MRILHFTAALLLSAALAACGSGSDGDSSEAAQSGNQANTDDHSCAPDVEIDIGDVDEIVEAAEAEGVEVDTSELEQPAEPGPGGGLEQTTHTVNVNVCGGTAVNDSSTTNDNDVTTVNASAAERIIELIHAGEVDFIQVYR